MRIFTLATAALLSVSSANAYDIAVRTIDGQTLHADVEQIETMDFADSYSPITFKGGASASVGIGLRATEYPLSFNAPMYWIVSQADEVDWMSFDTRYGLAGDNTILLKVKANPSKQPRFAKFTIMCGFKPIEITVTQGDGEESPYVEIPDENFRDYLLKNFDTDKDGQLSAEEADKITSVNVQDKGIASMVGIRRMHNLEELNCAYNELEGTLDISGLAKLKTARVDHNYLSRIDVSDCSALEHLEANDHVKWENYVPVYILEEINLSGCKNLKELELQDNALRSIDLSDCTQLTDLNLTINNLSEINLSNCANLVNLHLRKNKFEGHTVDLTGCPNLKTLFLSESGASGVNLTNNPLLVQLQLAYCNLADVDLSRNPNLESLEIFGNKLTSLDLTNNPKLKEVLLMFNQIEKLDLTHNPELVTVQANTNALTGTLDLSKNTKLEVADFTNNQLTDIKWGSVKTLTKVLLNNNLLTKLDLSGNSQLQAVVANNNNLSEVNLSGCGELSIVDFEVNQLASVDFTDNKALRDVALSRNKLITLNLSGCTELTEVTAAYNELASVDLRNLSHLTRLEIYNNRLAKLNLEGCSALDELHMHNNQIAYFSPKPLSALRYIDCRNNLLKSIDFSSNDNLDYAFGTDMPSCKTVYLSEKAPNTTIQFDETCEVFLGHPADFDDVDSPSWGDGDLNPW